MKRVKDILRNKGDQVWAVSPNVTVRDALQEMADKNIGAVLVMDQGHLAGIFSERDYARKLDLQGRRADETLVEEVMTRQVVGVRPDDSVDECMAIMTQRRIRHLPVVDGGEVAGIVSIGDVVKSIISEQQFLIEQLELYITGTPQRR
ncbi:MAG TPA: CBS domain-containing protein [Anaerolineae bacterium]|nr:CBS domain-containing protein [Anaerolineae bacterium]